MTSRITPSKYQVAIEEWYLKALQNKVSNTLVISAKAGSGKTTEIENLCAMLKPNGANPADAIALSFNVDIKTEFEKRLAPLGVTCKTINSLGNGVLWTALGKKRLKVDGWKYPNMIAEYLENMGIEGRVFTDTRNAVSQLVSFVMSSLINMDSNGVFHLVTDAEIYELVEKYGLDLPDALGDLDTFNLVRTVLDQGEKLALTKHLVSFDDQIYLPIKLNFSVPKYTYLFVDEAQDLSAAKLELALRACNGHTTAVFVGDEFQAIYGFAGADVDSMAKIIARTNATVLPLNYCYRCAKSIVAEAQKVVPGIEAAPDAIEGVVRTISDAKIIDELQVGDIVLSRTNAPLVKLTLKLLAGKKPARMKGRDFAKSLSAFAKNALGKNGVWSGFGAALESYFSAQKEKLSALKNSDSRQQLLDDKYVCIKVLYEGFNCTSLEDFEKQINGLFDDATGVIELSSVHRAKGLGRDRVFIIQPEKLPLVFRNQQDWQHTQELNLKYVALTRAKRELVYVTTTKKGAEE